MQPQLANRPHGQRLDQIKVRPLQDAAPEAPRSGGLDRLASLSRLESGQAAIAAEGRGGQPAMQPVQEKTAARSMDKNTKPNLAETSGAPAGAKSSQGMKQAPFSSEASAESQDTQSQRSEATKARKSKALKDLALSAGQELLSKVDPGVGTLSTMRDIYKESQTTRKLNKRTSALMDIRDAETDPENIEAIQHILGTQAKRLNKSVGKIGSGMAEIMADVSGYGSVMSAAKVGSQAVKSFMNYNQDEAEVQKQKEEEERALAEETKKDERAARKAVQMNNTQLFDALGLNREYSFKVYDNGRWRERTEDEKVATIIKAMKE